MLVFKERGKPEYLEKNLLEQEREPTTNLPHIRSRARNRTRATFVTKWSAVMLCDTPGFFFLFVSARSRPIVDMEGNITLNSTQIALEDNSTMQIASDGVSRKRYFQANNATPLDLIYNRRQFLLKRFNVT